MDEIVVRATLPSDAARLTDIWIDDAAYYAGLDPRAFRVPARDQVERVPVGEETDDDHVSLVAEVGGIVAGFADARVVEPVAHPGAQFIDELSQRRAIVDALVVERVFWRRGVGRALVSEVEDWARRRGAAVVCLETYAGSPVSVPFYEDGMGYERRTIGFRKRL
jgi:GNAT superfamily N-acetyltransferase